MIPSLGSQGLRITQEVSNYITFGKIYEKEPTLEEIIFHLNNGVKPTVETLPNLLKLKASCDFPSAYLDITNKVVKILILKGATCTTKTLNNVVQASNCSNKLVKMLIMAGAKPTDKTLSRTVKEKYMDPKIIATLLIAGVQPTLKHLNNAVRWSAPMTVWKKVKLFLLAGVKADKETLKIAVKNCSTYDYNNIKIINTAIKTGILPNEKLLNLSVCNIKCFKTILESGVNPTKSTLHAALEKPNLEILNILFESGVLPTQEDLINHLNDLNYDTLELLTSFIKPNTEILNVAIKNKLDIHKLVHLIENGAVVTDKTLELMKDKKNVYELEELEVFFESAIIGNSKLGIHKYDDKLKRCGDKYFVSETTMNLLQPQHPKNKRDEKIGNSFDLELTSSSTNDNSSFTCSDEDSSGTSSYSSDEQSDKNYLLEF